MLKDHLSAVGIRYTNPMGTWFHRIPTGNYLLSVQCPEAKGDIDAVRWWSVAILTPQGEELVNPETLSLDDPTPFHGEFYADMTTPMVEDLIWNLQRISVGESA